MKTRKLFTRAIAIVACLLMFSTNVLAANITLTATEHNGALKATIGGDAEGWVTFYAVESGTQFPAEADASALDAFAAKVQYVDQYQKTAAGNIEVVFSPRSGSVEKVDLYALGNGVEQIKVESGVSLVESIALIDAPATEDTYHVFDRDVDTASEQELRDFFAAAGNIKIKHYIIGSSDSTAETIVCNEETKALFTFEEDRAMGNKHYMAVAYDGIWADEEIILIEPDVPTALTFANADTVFDAYYNGDVVELTTEEIINAVTNNANGINADKNVTLTATYEDADPAVIALDDNKLVLDITAEAGTIYDEAYTHKVQPKLYGVATAEPLYFNLAKREINGATADDVAMSVFLGTTIDAAFVKANIPASSLNFKFTWNDLKKVVTDYELTNEMTFAQVGLPVVNGNTTVYTYNATLNGFTAEFDLTITETDMASIEGTVKAFDTTGQNANFADAIPVGAVVTAIPYNATAIGNYRGTAESYAPVSTVVDDVTGEFSLDLDPGTKYTLIISHTKYVVKNIGTVNQEVYVANSILDENTLRVIEPIGENVESLGVINLRYAYMGDIDADGKLDTVEADFIRGQFGSTVPGIE